ncbi:hypothetical protein QFZ40_004345 [Arthrobacter pascens]|nr:hypothetical protein [Arthrobacter pascens]
MHALPSVGCQVTPEQAWILAPLIAGQSTYRLGRWIGDRFQYPRPKNHPRITRHLPQTPAAVMVHGPDGSVATLCLDLDTSKAAPAVVRSDAARLSALLEKCGLRFVEDFSPSGGRHLYVPLSERLDGAQARALVEALALTCPSLDPGPHQNVTDGCIRVPGSTHKSGGHQVLVTPLTAAYDILRRRNPGTVVARLRHALAPELRRLQENRRRSRLAATPAGLTFPAPARETAVRRMARTGLYDSGSYASPSEARMAILCSMAASGHTAQDVRAAMTDRYPGLAALYGSKADRLLEKEFSRAVTFTAKSTAAGRGSQSAHINDTSHPEYSQGGLSERSSTAAVQQLANDVENVLYAVLDQKLIKNYGRESTGLRLLFRSVLGYVRTTGRDVLDVGCRTFAAANGKHHATIARLLPVLAAASDGILTKVADARGRNADVYLIQLPESYRKLAKDLSWRQGKIYGVRPVFRSLGDTAALVYEAIERSRLSPTTAGITRATGYSRTAVDNALAALLAVRMIHRAGREWRVTAGANLKALARRLGALEDFEEQVSRHRRERAAWQAWLDRHSTRIDENDVHDPEQDEYWALTEQDVGWAQLLGVS